jgi:histidinol-phosphate/aromatic aminotransferase/cobyric acid decarboxylase-like protein/choline kinase
MQALILAAGTGSRLGKHTKENTKCMLEVNGKTLIKHALDKINNVGIKKLILVVGYKKDNLIAHVGTKYKNVVIEYVENPIYNKTNNIYSLFLAKDQLAKDDTLLLESDLIFDEEILRRALNSDHKSLAVVDKYQSWMDGTAITIDENNSITGFYSKHLFRFQDVSNYYKTVNIYKFSKFFSNNVYIPFLEAYSKAMGDNEYYESVLRVVTMLEGQELKAMPLNSEKWYEIDDVQDKDNAEVIFARNSKEKLVKVQDRYGGYWRFPELKDFCYLVNPYFPPEKMQEEMKAYFYDLLSQYPSGLGVQNILAGKMFGVESENIVVGNGASEIIRSIGSVLEGSFGIMYPTFNEYPESIGGDRIINSISEEDDFSYSIEDLKILLDSADNLIVVNPDNPSGNFIPKKDLLGLLDYADTQDKSIIIDESFVDFAEDGANETLITQEIIDKYPGLFVIKSISKSYGVPGIRLGVVVGSNLECMNKFKKEITIWNINSFGEYFLQIIGKYKSDYQQACSLIRDERDRFYQELQTVKYLNVYPSSANYFLCSLKGGIKASKLVQELLDKHQIFIKDLTGKIGFMDKEYIRIAVRDKVDNNYLIDILVKYKKNL